MTMNRLLCLDIGTVRIGVAVSDPLGSFAQGLGCWKAQGPWLDELKETLERYETNNLLLGLPLREDGSEGPMAEKVRAVAARIQARFPEVKIQFWDERYTSRIATNLMLEGDVSRRKRKGRVDQIAASLILQSYIDARGVDSFH